MGGDNNSDNIAILTPEEHYIAHQLLIKIYPSHNGLVWAAGKMTSSSSCTKRPNNKLYSWLRNKMQQEAKNRMGNKNGRYGKSWWYNSITLENGVFNDREVPVGWIKGRKPVKTTLCQNCFKSTNKVNARWCDDCRQILRKKPYSPIKNIKTKLSYSVEDKLNALQKHDNNIRRALFSLGLNDSGPNYKMMKQLITTVYP